MSDQADLSGDVVVIGAGHNALICAAYLAKAGLEVVVLEASSRIGGNTVTEELTLPGWQHDSCSSAHALIQSNPVLRDDELGLISDYGLEYAYTEPATVFPLGDGDALVVHRSAAQTAEEIARFSPEDARRLTEMLDEWAALKGEHRRWNAGLEPSNTETGRAYRALRSRSAWDVVVENFKHPVTRHVLSWMGFATFHPPKRTGTGVLPISILNGRLEFGWATPIGAPERFPIGWPSSFVTAAERCSATPAFLRFRSPTDAPPVSPLMTAGALRQGRPSCPPRMSCRRGRCSALSGARSSARPPTLGGPGSRCLPCTPRSRAMSPTRPRPATASDRPLVAWVHRMASCVRSRAAWAASPRL